MSIYSINNQMTYDQALTVKNSRSASVNKSETVKKTGESTDVKVTLSSQSKEMLASAQTTNDSEEIREDKIARLKKEIGENTYAVDPEVIADKMVSYFSTTA